MLGAEGNGRFPVRGERSRRHQDHTRASWQTSTRQRGRDIRSDEQVEAYLDQYDPVPLGLLENHYMANGCFFEEGQIFRDAGKLSEIPTIFVNGRYDVICPTRTAYRLSRMLPKSKLVIAESSGHWMGDPKLQEALLEAVREFE